MFSYTNIVVGILLALVSASSIAGDMSDMLKRMSEVNQTQNYHGTFILRKSDKLSTMNVEHGVDEQGIWERMESLDGEAKKVLRHNNRIVSVYPDRQLVTVRRASKQQSLHRQLPENIGQLASFYSMIRLDDDRIANRQALVIDLKPKDRYRYGYKYWIDKETGMLLRCDLVSEKNGIVAQMMFTSLEYSEKPSFSGFDVQQFERFNQQVKDETVDGNRNHSIVELKIEKLPGGFMLTQNTMRYSRPSSIDALQENETVKTIPPDLQHLVYTDGLASVSVFIERNKGGDKHLHGASSMGGVNAFGYSMGEFFVTVVGEVPEETVQLMAKSAVKMP